MSDQYSPDPSGPYTRFSYCKWADTGCDTNSTEAGPGGTVAVGAPPTDGSVDTLIYKDTDTGIKYINLGTAASPDWDAI